MLCTSVFINQRFASFAPGARDLNTFYSLKQSSSSLQISECQFCRQHCYKNCSLCNKLLHLIHKVFAGYTFFICDYYYFNVNVRLGHFV